MVPLLSNSLFSLVTVIYNPRLRFATQNNKSNDGCLLTITHVVNELVMVPVFFLSISSFFPQRIYILRLRSGTDEANGSDHL